MRLITLAGIAATGVTLATTVQAASKRPATTTYRAYVASSTSNDSCYGPVGAYVSLDGQFTRTQTLKAARQLQRAGRPSSVSVKLFGSRRKLRLDSKSSGVDSKRIWWNFQRVKLTRSQAKRLVGKRLVVQYRLRGKSVRRAATVQPGDCGM